MSNSKILVGFLAGAAVGALAGVLLAPDKGSETRKKIAGKAGELRDAVKDKYNEMADGLRKTFNRAEEGVEELAEKATAKAGAVRSEMKNALS